MIRRVLPLLLLLLAACGGDPETPEPASARVTDMGAEPQAQETPESRARYTPPPGTWRVRSESLAPGEWYEEYASEDASVLMRVHIFPIRTSRVPAPVLGTAIDTFLRSLGSEGFGAGDHRYVAVLGAPAAQVTWSAVVGTRTVTGGARILRTADDHWAFAVGYMPADDTAQQELVSAFVQSLEPAQPVFYARRFFKPEDLELIVIRKPGEEPVTQRDLIAVELVLEAGAGIRFPLSTRPAVRGALREDVASAKEQRTRDSYRETGAAFAKAAELSVKERLDGMEALGRRSLQALLQRANEGYAPAIRIARVLDRLREMAVGTPEDGLTVGAVRCLHEQCAFLASLAANREVRPDIERGDRIAKALAARWGEIAPEERKALRQTGTAWARLRKAWDDAPEEARTAMRRTVAFALATPEQRKQVEAAANGRALLAWMEALPESELDGLVMRAAALSMKQRADLAAGLDLASTTGWDLGW
ncbi:MAG: hypothetical protein QNJ90_16330 [Planctomycetota bacterium]|nr:hypothetical protein [Planctomycetota bacterium]